MFKYILSVLLFLINLQLSAQKEAANWIFGQGIWLNFNTSPVSLGPATGHNFFNSQTSSISDSNGNLLFIGCSSTILDKNLNNIIPINAIPTNNLLLQGNLEIPIVNAQTYLQFNLHSSGCYYTQIDMTLNGGLGGVPTGKLDLLLVSDTIAKQCAVKQSGNSGYWLLLRGRKKFYLYLIDNLNFNTTSKVINTSITDTIFQSQMKFNFQADKIAGVVNKNQIEFYNFNSFTGELLNPVTYNFSNYFTTLRGFEFSPDGNKLYFSGITKTNKSQIIQVSIINGIPDFSNYYVVAESVNTRNYYALQLAIDDKIYIANNLIKYISVINNPNDLNSNCNFLNVGFNLPLPGYTCYPTLPSFVANYFNTNATFSIFNTCAGIASNFVVSSNKTITSSLWSFGDSQSSTVLNPTHTYTSAGTYTVALTVTYADNSTQTISKQITIYPKPQNINLIYKY
jgi:PKD repeat protein